MIAIPVSVLLTLVVLRAVTNQSDFAVSEIEFGYRDNAWVAVDELPMGRSIDDMEMRFTVVNDTDMRQVPSTGWRPASWDRTKPKPLSPVSLEVDAGEDVVRYVSMVDVLCGFIDWPEPPVLIYAQAAVLEPVNSRFAQIPDTFVEEMRDPNDCAVGSNRNPNG